jgi:hypothetical protein
MVVQILPVPVIALVTDWLVAMADALSGMVHIDLLHLLYWCCSQKTVTEVDSQGEEPSRSIAILTPPRSPIGRGRQPAWH